MFDLFFMVFIFAVGAASPGPATLMILNTAVSRGRKQAIALALGVATGTLFWAIITTSGLGIILETSVILFTLIKIAGGCYLAWLAFKMLKSAWINSPSSLPHPEQKHSFKYAYLSGVLLHITNPKAALVWVAVLSVGLNDISSTLFLITATTLCWLTAFTIFMSYALLFSTKTATRIYLAIRRPFDAVLGVLFGAAALKMLSLRAGSQ